MSTMTRHRSKVLSLTMGLNNLVLGSCQGGVTLNATVRPALRHPAKRDLFYANGHPP